MSGTQSAAMRHYFFAERLQQDHDAPKDTPLIPIRKVGVIGAGTMGGGISMNFSAGIPVTILEMARTRSTVAPGHAQELRNTAKKGRMTEQVEQAMGLLTPTLL